MYESLVNSNYLDIGYHDSIAIVIGWYPLSVFTKKIDKSLYTVAGNLFNAKMGTNYLIRNLLHNNHIKYLLFLSATKEDMQTKTCDYALQVFKGEVPLSEINMSDTKIASQAFNELQQDLCFEIYTDIPSLQNRLSSIHSNKSHNCVRSKYTFEIKQDTTMTNILPSSLTGHNIVSKTIRDAYYKALKRVVTNGQINEQVQEILNLCITIEPDNLTLSQFIKTLPSVTQAYVYNFLHGTESKENYGYGDRILVSHGFNQVKELIEKIQRKPSTLAGVLQIWKADDLVKGNSPCLTQIWCRYDGSSLHMFATFRSNDIFRAWKSNISALKALHLYICEELKILPGTVSTISLSAHIYHQNLTDINRYLEEFEKIPQFNTFYSHCGNFAFSVSTAGIYVEHYDNEGRKIDNYKGIDSQLLMHQIIEKNPTLEPTHVAYIAQELELCRICFYRGIDYIQGKTRLNDLLRKGML